MLPPDDANQLVTLASYETDFEAQAVVAALQEAGVDAFAFGTLTTVLPMSAQLTPVLVQVRRTDLARAQAALAQIRRDSADLDWNEVDVGEREDSLPLKSHRRMPLVVRLGFYVAILVLAVMLAGFVVATLGLFGW